MVGRRLRGDAVMMDETEDWDRLSPWEKLESPRGQYLIAQALHYGLQQMMRFPDVRRADNDCDDMREILEGCFPQWSAHFREGDRRWAEVDKPRIVDEGFRRLGEVEDDEED